MHAYRGVYPQNTWRTLGVTLVVLSGPSVGCKSIATSGTESAAGDVVDDGTASPADPSLCVVNDSGQIIKSIHVTGQIDGDWRDERRPDQAFESAVVNSGGSLCAVVALNPKAAGTYAMTLGFANGTSLDFANEQRDAYTKHNQTYPASGSSGFTLYQASGGGTNALYVRNARPSNSGWMASLLRRKPDVQLNQVVMPGSHDAGMYTTLDCSAGLKPEWVRTQGLTIGEQLTAGARYFDLRPFSRDADHGLYLGNFAAHAGCYGAKLTDVLTQVADFLYSDAGSGEAVFLKFSHTGQDGQGAAVDPQAVINMITSKFGARGRLYLSPSPAAPNLSTTRLAEVAGKVVAVFDAEYAALYRPTGGILPFRGVPFSEPGPEGQGLRVYDENSNASDPAKMALDQMNKLTQAGGGPGTDYQFQLSWTVTGQWPPTLSNAALDLEVAAKTMVTPSLGQNLDKISAATQSGLTSIPNLVSMDFIDPWTCRTIIGLNSTQP